MLSPPPEGVIRPRRRRYKSVTLGGLKSPVCEPAKSRPKVPDQFSRNSDPPPDTSSNPQGDCTPGYCPTSSGAGKKPVLVCPPCEGKPGIGAVFEVMG